MTTDTQSFSTTALGTSVHVVLARRASLSEARRVVEAELAAVDNACSRFRQDSDLARTNRAGGATVGVSELFVVAVEVALRAARETDGDVDPTIGRAVRLAGYDRDFSSLPAALPARRFGARHVPGWQRVVVDRTRCTVTVPGGVELDLGATAKALAADRAARAVQGALGVGALVSLGGDVATAGPPPADGWRIGVSDDHRTPCESVSQTVSLVSGGLATSSTTVRRWRVGDDTAHHLIDPHTARSAVSRWRTVSVAAGSCVDANIASTAAIIRSVAGPGLALRARASRSAGDCGRRRYLRGRLARRRSSCVTVLAINSSTLWYLTRGTGVVSLLLLTASVALGVVGAVGWRTPGWPRFLTTGLHRNISLLVLVFLTVHIGAAVADSYAPITLAQAVIPFTSTYRPIWLGLGALAFDMLLAIVITSLARRWLGFRGWRTVHWLAYAGWPVAVVHGLGTGTDSRFTWMMVLTGACVAAVVACVWWRAGTGLVSARDRSAAFAASVAVPLLIGAWYVTGPLQAGWSRRAGTPIALIRSAGVSRGSPVSNVVDVPGVPFRGRIVGRLTETSPDQTGTVTVTINAHVTGGVRGTLVVTLRGQPFSDGTIQIASGQVTFGPPSRPALYTGAVFVASDGRLVARVTGGRTPIDLRLLLTVDHSTGAVTGVLDADQSHGDAPAPPGVDGDGQESE